MAKLKSALTLLLSVFFILSGCNHFLHPAFYLRMMPAYLPWHRALVQASGVAEAGLGALVLLPRARRKAGWGIVALLIAVFPANIDMALHPERFPEFRPAVLWIRLPLQFALSALVLWCTRPRMRPIPKSMQ